MITYNIKKESISSKGMQLYRKKHFLVHAVYTDEIAECGSQIIVHTLEGDVAVTAGPDQYIMIGPKYEVYSIKKDLFDGKYGELTASQVEEAKAKGQAVTMGENSDDIASLIAGKITGDSVEITNDRIHAVMLTRDTFVFARRMDEEVRVISKNVEGATFYGKFGDYLCIGSMDPDDVYIVDGEIMEFSYEEVL